MKRVLLYLVNVLLVTTALLAQSVSAAGVAKASASAAPTADPAKGKALSVTCMACHGTDGNSSNPEWPKLSAQHPRYLVKQLEEFKSGERDNAIMKGFAVALSDQDRLDLAGFYATQARTGGFVSEDKKALGERIYRAGNAATGTPACMGCHGPAGKGDPRGGFPSLDGQHSTYVLAQLRLFAAGSRANDPSGMMRDVARHMSPAEMEAVAEYVSALH